MPRSIIASRSLRRSVSSSVILALACQAMPAFSQSWANFGSGSGTPAISGSLLGNPISITSAYPSGTPATGVALTPAPGINPPFNSYCIWDSAVPENSAQLWPASASVPGCAQQIIVGVGAAATAANPVRFSVAFGQPVVNPKLMVYSFDNSAMSMAATRDVGGNPAVLTVAFNNAGVYNAATQSFGTTGTAAIPEGCANNATPGRACAYVNFVGTYSQLLIDFNLTSGTNDGIGFNFGADASVPVTLQAFQID